MQKEFHNLKTVKEIVNVVTAENVDVLAEDFKLFLKFQLQTRGLDLAKFGGLEGMAINEIKMGEVFRWCDDGESGLKKINIEIDFQSPIKKL